MLSVRKHDAAEWEGGRDGYPALHTSRLDAFARWSSRAHRRWRRFDGQTKAEVYDPRAPTVAPADHMIARQKGHRVLTLPGGKLDFPDGGALHVRDGTEVRA